MADGINMTDRDRFCYLIGVIQAISIHTTDLKAKEAIDAAQKQLEDE